MLEASNGQNPSVDLDVGTSAEESNHEGERRSPNLPPTATSARKKRNNDDDDEDFLVEEVTSKEKKTVLAKEYGTASSSRPAKASLWPKWPRREGGGNKQLMWFSNPHL